MDTGAEDRQSQEAEVFDLLDAFEDEKPGVAVLLDVYEAAMRQYVTASHYYDTSVRFSSSDSTLMTSA